MILCVAARLFIVGLSTFAVSHAENTTEGAILHGDFGLWKEYYQIRPFRSDVDEDHLHHAFIKNDLYAAATLEPYLQNKLPYLLGLNMFAVTAPDEWLKWDQNYPEPDDDENPQGAIKVEADPNWDQKQKAYLDSYKLVNTSWSSVKANPYITLDGVKVPRRIDWRTRMVVPNYEAICCTVDCRYGSYAWAVVVTLVSHLNMKMLEDERYNHTLHPPTLYSIQQLIDCLRTDDVNMKNEEVCKDTKGGGNGRTYEVIRAYKHVIMNGLLPDYKYSYQKGNSTSCRYNRNKIVSGENPFTGFVKIDRYDEVSLVQALALYGPITVSFNANLKEHWLYENGILVPTECKTGKTVSMVLVGYGSERDIRYWLLMSPWGERYGRSGMLKLQWFTETKGCNIAGQAIFPTWGGRKTVTSYDWQYWKDIDAKRAKYVARVYTQEDLNDRRRIYDPI